MDGRFRDPGGLVVKLTEGVGPVLRDREVMGTWVVEAPDVGVPRVVRREAEERLL